MRDDENIFFLMGDTGFNLVEPLFNEFPDRTMNVGVAEQNLIGIAAGLSNVGFKPVCYAISNFLVHRCLEQIRNDLCLHDYPATLVGTSSGLDNGALWATHYIIDDIACLKSLPNVTIYSPSSIESINKISEEAMKLPHPSYIRITKSSFSEGKAIDSINRYVLKNDESDVLIISHGRMVKNSLEASKLLPKFSIFAMDKIKPIDEKVLENIITSYNKIVIIEDNLRSGLYNSVCQFVFDKGLQDTNLYSISVKEDFGNDIGDTSYLDDKFGLSPSKIAAYLQNLMC